MPTKALRFSRKAFPEAPVRSRDLEKLASCLQRGECCSLVGASNSGKSILLRSLLTPEVRCYLEGGEPRPLVVVFIDCLASGDTESDFLVLVLQRIIEELEAVVWPSTSLENLKGLYGQLLRSVGEVACRSIFASAIHELVREEGARYILILDELDDAFRGLPSWPFRYLRTLRDSLGSRLCYVTATSYYLGKLRSDLDTYEFRELFLPATIVLSSLDEGDARRLMAYLGVKGGKALDAKSTSLAIQFSGGHPGLLAQLYHFWRSGKQEGFSEGKDLLSTCLSDQAIVEECQRLWEELEEAEQEALALLAKGGEGPFMGRQEQALSLMAKGLVVARQDGSLAPSIPIFAEFLRGQSSRKAGVIACGIRCHEGTGQIWVDEREVTLELSSSQRRLVWLLWRKQGGTCSKDEIVQAIWPEAKGDVFDAAIYELIKRTRQKLEPNPRRPRYLVTVPGEGYRLESSP